MRKSIENAFSDSNIIRLDMIFPWFSDFKKIIPKFQNCQKATTQQPTGQS